MTDTNHLVETLSTMERITMKPMAHVSRVLAVGLAVAGLLFLSSAAAQAAPNVTTSPAASEITDGSKVTVTASGFPANTKAIAVGQCRVPYAGPADCNISGGAALRSADASGAIPDTMLTISATFTTGSGASVDCNAVKCVIGIAPLPTSNPADVVSANTVDIPLEFGAAETDTVDTDTSADSENGSANANADLPKTGPTDSLPVILIGGSALILTGAGVLVLMPRRRRLEVR